MAAPTISTPEFKATMPVSGKPYRYRPFLVGEEKSLLAAKESGDDVRMLDEMRRVVLECTYRELDPSAESMVDVANAFLLVRARSVGEIARIKFPCDCGLDGAMIEAEVDLTKMNIEVPKTDPAIDMGTTPDGDRVIMTLRPMTFDDYVKAQQNAKDDGADVDVESLKCCVVDVATESGDSYDPDSWTDREWKNFHDGMQSSTFKRVAEFFDNSPKISLEVSGRCDKCRKTVTRVINDTRNFT